MEYISEYDAFGPWIYEIDEGHEVPRIFRKYYNAHGRPLMLFKVPRKIERRNATPDMDLYDYLIGAYDKYLCILKRDGENVVEKKIYYKDICAVNDTHVLIKGELVFFTEDDRVSVHYNTISEDIILRFLTIVEKGYAQDDMPKIKADSIPIEYIPDNADSLDFLFTKLLSKLKEINPAVSLVAYQPRINLKKDSPEWSKGLSRIAFSLAENELIILQQETPLKKEEKEDLNYSFLHLPLRHIMGIGINGFDKENLLYETQISAGNQTYTFVVENRHKRIFDLYKKLNKINESRR